MPPLEEAELPDIITLYPFSAQDQLGHMKHGPGVEIKARWVNINRQVIEPDSSVINIVADVIVDRSIKPGSLLWNGRLADYSDGTGTGDIELVEVRFEHRVKDIKGQTTRYNVQCTRYLQDKDTVV